ncbi:NAD(P)-dependent oxidoreductase [Lentzea nigeriaca]|uniref:NAD(P)-dependent oxidoreductase n=1 Tax=Lentzea nigeriaca TaxID=1128665 RepID=UPI0027DAF3B5|nr:NAD(P)-dependent oxidoreductase [Lentzea nigeriaca]MBM7856366.1 3-hydroxyisobutyrate dehydrogenase [Lentzea nigeriaca]
MIGFLGLGSMGSGMANRLLDAGFEVVVHNRTAAKAEALAERGAKVASSPAEVARVADVLLLSLATGDVVEEMLFGPSGALTTGENLLIADMSTVSPDAARALAARVSEQGHRILDACVLGNAQHAATGELRFMIGGDAADVESLRPVLDPLAKEIVHLGDHGMGATAKVAMNLLMGVQMQALAEAVVLGERSGLRRDVLIKMIAASGYSSPVMKFKSGVMARRAFAPADFRLALMRKDLMLALADAARLGIPMPATQASYEVLTSALNSGHGELDCAAVLAEVERMAGVSS